MAYKLGTNQDISHLAHELYFESASMILVLVSFGKYLESKSKNKTNEAIEKLMNLVPKTAIIIKDNNELEIPVENVKLNDIIIVKKGMRIELAGEMIINGYMFYIVSFIGISILPPYLPSTFQSV